MTITEIALLLLSPDITISNPDLRSKLSHAKTIMQNYTSHTFYYMQQIEDPAYIYIIGEWDSLDQHMNHFIPGPENQAVLASLKDALTVPQLEHIDAPHSVLPLPRNSAKRERALRGELVWSISRHFVKLGEKAAFQETFDANKQYLQEFVTEGTIGGGWRVGKEDGREEFVLFCLWKSVEQHLEFRETKAFERYGRIREFFDGVEIRHVRLLDIGGYDYGSRGKLNQLP
jgi:quinol monooxygenase YgiN